MSQGGQHAMMGLRGSKEKVSAEEGKCCSKQLVSKGSKSWV